MARISRLRAWEGKILYLVLLDRFANGDASRDNFGCDEYSPTDPEKFQGGDLEGLRRRLPALKRLGIDAIWLTPPTHGQWINPTIATRGYHGYWPYDFTAVDPHFGSIEDYRRMVADAHGLGMKVIQDIVVNHTGNFFTVVPAGYDPKHPERNWRQLTGAYPPDGDIKAPNDPIFRMNDPRDRTHREAGVYNFTPNISDYRSRRQTLTHAMGDLDDINLNNALAARRMREIYRFWIEQVGIDGFRVDTVFYTPESFYDDFLRKSDANDLGIKNFAARRGKKEFFVFGEVWSYDYKAIGRYLEGPRGPRLDSAVDLPLNEALNQIFFRKSATDGLRAPLTARKRNPDLWITFADNHDVERVYARGSARAARQCLAALFTLPGLPCVYYGTEAGLTGPRQHMFDESLTNPKRPENKFLRALISLRKRHVGLAIGEATVEDSGASCGILSYVVAGGKRRYRAVFNTAPERRAYALPNAGKRAVVLLASDNIALSSVLTLPPDSFLILDESSSPVKKNRPPSAPALTLKSSGPFRKPFPVQFSLPKGLKRARLDLLCDDDLDRRRPIRDTKSGFFLADPETLGEGIRRLRLLSTAPNGARSLSAPIDVALRCRDRLLVEKDVPQDNKGGFAGRRLRPPTEASYDGQLSLEGVRVCSRGRDLTITVLMNRVTDSWNPPEGYDHVYFSVFFQFPGLPGVECLPKMAAKVPGFNWNAGFLLYGWGSRSFSATGSSPEGYGPPLPGEVKQSADTARRTVTFVFSERCFGPLKDYSGARLLITTWDGYLGELRALSATPQDWEFSVADGGPLDAPRIYDHMLLDL
ncbi:MAG: alpha-amylase family glycosyl hydrolase [Elusimicrobiota bacterium]